ncbi:MAG: carboxypeptidase-like regulatory domain-containing protein [Acidobacteriota bacterium]|nr:carboxypeptidase-like regulatory domain-containing protein [Acidobacteriota bacterium]
MRLLFALLVFAVGASAAVDGTVTNATSGRAQAGATVTLFQPTSQGPQFIDSVKTDAQGRFQITKQVPAGGAGPLLLQAVYAGVQYNKILPPGTPTSGVEIPVYEASKKPGDAKIEQHMILLEPSPGGILQVSESYVFKNEGKTTWNDPDGGTLQFALPAAAQGKVEVNVLAPGGMSIRRAPDPGPKPNTFKLDFPIKPGDSRVDMQWSMPFNTPGVFENRDLMKQGQIRLVAPVGVTFKGDDLQNLGQEPRTKATIFGVKGPDIRIRLEGTGTLSDPNAGGSSDDAASGAPALKMSLPKLYGLASGASDFFATVLAVKWVLLSVFGMLATGFVLLYRKGNPDLSGSGEPATKASKNVRGRG